MATYNGRLPALLPLVIIGFVLFPCVIVPVQSRQINQASSQADEEFGPVVRAYLGYLKNEQEVVDDRVSRREVNASYYRHNSNRIKALRQMAIRVARETHNDYLPELEAVSAGEMSLVFGPQPPPPARLKVGEVLRTTFRYLGPVRVAGEVFYLFARLDPYEQAELTEKAVSSKAATSRPEKNQR